MAATPKKDPPAPKLDVKKSLPGYQAKVGRFNQLTLEPRRYLAVDGRGDPNTAPRYQDALASLYPLAYTLKFNSKNQLHRDYVVPPLEGLWWAEDYAAFTTARDKNAWQWTMLLYLPEWLKDEDVATAAQLTAAASKTRASNVKPTPLLTEVYVKTLHEGHCVQTLHVGPYDAEATVLQQLHRDYLPQHRLQATGLHHEIYLSDPRRVAAEKLKTILRQPVRLTGAASDEK